MARRQSFSSECNQLSREFIEGRAEIHELARRYSLSRELTRLRVRKYEAREFMDELAEAVRIAEYEENDANYSIVSGPGPSPCAASPLGQRGIQPPLHCALGYPAPVQFERIWSPTVACTAAGLPCRSSVSPAERDWALEMLLPRTS